MPRVKQSPVPMLISSEELRGYDGLTLRVKGESIDICWRNPLDNGKRSLRAGTIRSKPDQIREALDRVHTQVFLGGKVPKARTRVPIAVLWDGWRASVDLRPNTLAVYDSVWTHHLSEATTHWNATTLNPDLVNAWLDSEVATRRMTPAIRTKAANVLRHLLTWGHQRGLLLRDNGAGIAGGKEAKPKKGGYLEIRQAERLIEAVRDIDPYYVPHMYVLLYTGIRISELAGLRWSPDIDLEPGRGKITVEHNYIDGELSSLKTDAANREVPLTETVRQEIAAFKERQPLYHERNPLGLAFTSKRGYGLNDNTFRSRIFRPAVKACEFPTSKRVTPHTLRHTFLTHLADTGTPIHVLMDLAGHTDYRMTNARYIGRTPKAQDAARVDIEAAFPAVVPDKAKRKGPGWTERTEHMPDGTMKVSRLYHNQEAGKGAGGAVRVFRKGPNPDSMPDKSGQNER